MAKREYINSAMGLYGVGSPTGNLYTNAQSKAKRADKKSQQAENFTKPIGQMNAEEFLYACGAFGVVDKKYNADGETNEILEDDNFDFFPIQNPDTGKLVDLKIGEGLYSLTNGDINFYANKNTYVNDKKPYGYSLQQTIGYVKDTGTAKRGNKTIRVSNEFGKDLNKKVFRDFDWIDHEQSIVAVMRKVDENGNMTDEPYTTIEQKSKFEKVANVLTLGGYGLTKFTIQASIGAGKWLLSKDERKKVDEFNKTRKKLNKNIDKLVEYQDDIKNLQIDLARQSGNPNDKVEYNKDWNAVMNDFAKGEINKFINDYTDGVKLKNYLDKKCKENPYPNADYGTILERLYGGVIKKRNEKVSSTGSYATISVVNDVAKEIYGATEKSEKELGDSKYGLTKAIWNNVPTKGNNVSVYALVIAFMLQRKKDNGYDSVNDENSENYYNDCVKICSLAFWFDYLLALRNWAKDYADKDTAFIRKYMVDKLVEKGYPLPNLRSLAVGSYAENEDEFYKEIIIKNRWANSLSTFEQYPIFDTDYTLMCIEDIYNKCVAINSENLSLEKKINELVKESYVAKYKNQAVGVLNDFKAKMKAIKDRFDESSPYRRAVKRGRELKRELLPLREQGAYLEADMEKIEANMVKIKKDIETYQMILDDASNGQSEKDNADKMLDKLTNDLDGWLTKQENKIAEHDKLDEKDIKPRETEFETLGTIVTKVLDIYGSYKRKDARKTYRIKKREVKDELKRLYGKGWRKEGDWKNIKIEFKVERNAILEQYQSVFGKVAHGALAFVLMPARNIVTVLLMLNIGGATTRLEQMKNVHDGNGKTSDEIKIRNYYELILQRWYSIGGKKEFLDKIIAKYGKAKPIANKSTDPDAILKENGTSAEKIAEMESEVKLDATGKQYLNFVVSEYITTILGYVKSFFGWLLTQLKTWGSVLLSLFGKLFGGGDDDAIVGNGSDYDPAEDCAGQLALLESFLATNPDPMPTDEQKQNMTDLICDNGYTFQQAYEEVMGIKLAIKTDANGNTIIEEEGNTALGIGIGVGIGILALGGILWAVLSD